MSNKTIVITFAAVLALTAGIFAKKANATPRNIPFLAVDINGTGSSTNATDPPGLLQTYGPPAGTTNWPTWQGWHFDRDPAGGPSWSKTFDSVSVTITKQTFDGSDMKSRARTGPPDDDAYLGYVYRDFIYVAHSTAVGWGGDYLQFAFSGLEANKYYEFTFWNYDAAIDSPKDQKFAAWGIDNPGNYPQYQPTVGGGGLAVKLARAPIAGAYASDDVNLPGGQDPFYYTGRFIAKTNGSGQITIYGWNDSDVYTGSQHFPVNGFATAKMSYAHTPSPTDGETQVTVIPTLTWQAGWFAQDSGGHHLYFGTDFDEVNNATTDCAGIYVGDVTSTSYSISTELTGNDYYWRIDEVNDANANSPWKGDVWQFTTINALSPTPWLHVEGNKIKDESGNTVVLRGVSMIDLGATEIEHGGALNLIDRITNRDDANCDSPGWYTKILRIPVCPHKSPLYTSSPVTFNPEDVNDPDNEIFYELLREVVDYCAEKEIYAIIDWHDMNNTSERVADTSAFWEFIAPRFADDSHVLFELFNEPINTSGTDAQRWESVRADMQTWVDIVRTYAPNNLILVGTPSYDQILAPVVDNPVDDSNVAYVCHIYPYHWLGLSGGSQEYYTNQITTCAEVYPVICTEWGFTNDPDYYGDSPVRFFDGTITNYGEPIKAFFEEHGIGNTAWVADYSWSSPMFYSDWTLRSGEGEMGCFVKDWLYEADASGSQTVDTTITKCTVKAGKTQGINDEDIANIKDSFNSRGIFSSSPTIMDDVNYASFEVEITSTADGNETLIYSESGDGGIMNLSTNKYKYSSRIARGAAGRVTSIVIDFNKKTFSVKAKNIDLTGLGDSLRLDITIGNIKLSGEADETIINGSKKRIPTRLMRLYQDKLIVTKAKAKNGTSPLRGSLSVKGEIAIENITDTNMVNGDVVITWGDQNDTATQTFTIPAGSFVADKTGNVFKCSKIVMDTNDSNEGTVTAKFYLLKSTFTISVKNADTLYTDTTQDALFGINFTNFADFNRTADVNLVTGRSY